MPEAIQIAVTPGAIPPMPASAQPSTHSRDMAGAVPPVPPSGQQVPGFVNENQQPGTYTAAQMADEIAKAVAAATAGKQPTPVAAPAKAAPVAYDFKTDAAADPVLTSYTQMFTAAATGVDIDRAVGRALQYNDPNLIDVAYLNEVGGANAGHLHTMAKAIVERIQTQTAAATEAVYAVAGNKQQWDTVSAVFNSKAPDYLKQVVSTMMDSGKPDVIKAGAQQVVEWTKAQGLVPTQAGLVHPNASGMSGAGALSKADFQAEKLKLNVNDRNYAAQVGALLQRRQLGKNSGIN